MSKLSMAIGFAIFVLLIATQLDPSNTGCVPDEELQRRARRIDYRFRGIVGDYRQRAIAVETSAVHTAGQRLCSESDAVGR